MPKSSDESRLFFIKQSKLDLDRPLAPQIARLLRKAIVTMRIEPGERLSEQEVADVLGVNRFPVREAFQLLRDSGLIRVMPQRGTFVLKISPGAFADAAFVRQAMECAVVRMAATERNPHFFSQLKQNLAAQRQLAKRKDLEAFFACDDDFHHLIAEAAGRVIAWNIIDDYKPQLDRVRFLSLIARTQNSEPVEKIFENSLNDHHAIFEALDSGDADAAELEMKNHLGRIVLALPRFIERFPGMFRLDEDSQQKVSSNLENEKTSREGRANQSIRST